MTTLTIELPADLVARLERLSDETGQPLQALVADALTSHFISPSSDDTDGRRIRLRPVRFVGWPEDTIFRREDIYGDDAR